MLRSTVDTIRRRHSADAPDILLVALACLVAFVGAAWVSSSVFERLPHTEDESAFLFQAQTVASGRIVADAPELPEPFEIPFIILRDGVWFGKYPPGFPMVLAIGVLFGQPWLVNATFAALCVLLAYAVARRFYGVTTARIAAPLLALSPFLLLQAGSLLSHTVSLFWTLLFLYLFPIATKQQGALLPVAAGASIGMLFLTRPLTAVGVALPFGLWMLYNIATSRGIHRSYIGLVLSALPFAAAYLAYNDFTTGSPFRTAYELWWPFDRIGFGPDRGLDGHDMDDALRNTRINFDSLAAYLFGWPGRTSVVPALAVVISSGLTLLTLSLRRQRTSRSVLVTPRPENWDMLLAGVVVGVIGIHLLYWTPGQMYGPRYYMETIGPLAILTARCLEQIRSTTASIPGRIGRPLERASLVSTVALVLVLAVLTGYAHLSWAPQEYDRFRGWNEITGDDLAYVESQSLSNALVIVDRESWTDYAPFFTRNSPSLDTDVVYASDRGPGFTDALIQRYPDRRIYLYSNGNLVELSP